MGDEQDSVQSHVDKVLEQVDRARAEAADDPATRRKPRKPRASAAPVDESGAALEKVLERLEDQKYWRGLVQAPADLAFLKTGHPHWTLKESEVDALATTGMLAVRAWLPHVQPKWLCLLLFGANVTIIYGGRMLEEIRLTKAEEAQRHGPTPA